MEREIRIRNKKQLENLLCPYSLNNSNPGVDFCCKTDDCSSWVDDDDDDDGENGYCKLIESR